jgi:hypothetical protein
VLQIVFNHFGFSTFSIDRNFDDLIAEMGDNIRFAQWQQLAELLR